MDIAQKSFIVTGGASGLGAACVRRLVAEGASVLIADVNEEAGVALVEELKESTGSGTGSELPVAPHFHATDVTDEASMQAAVDTAVQEFGGLHGAILCAGILGASRVVGRRGPHDLDLYRRVIEVNLVGSFNAMRLAAAAMANNDAGEADDERGVVIMTSSVAAFEGQLGQAAYSASKGGVASMVLPAARELGTSGIRVAAIAPGVFATPMMNDISDEYCESLESQVPFPPRLGDPAEFANLAMHILENRMLNGCVLRLDGALRMGAK